MAFLGLLMVSMIIYIIIIGILFVTTVASLIISIVMRINYNKKLKNYKEGDKKPRKWYYIPRAVFILNITPLVIIIASSVINVIKSDYDDRHSLSYNINKGNYEIVEELLKDGVSPNCTYYSNEPAKDGEQTILSLLCDKSGFVDTFRDPVDEELTEEEMKMIKLLIKYGADVNAVNYKHESTHEDHYGDVEEKENFALDDECGYTPLMYAVISGETELVKLLIENGADVNVKDFSGFTPVATVAYCLDDDPGVEILNILIENGADINTKNNYGQTNEELTHMFRDDKNPGIREILRGSDE